MPSRPVSLLIVLLWIGTTSWLVQRDILPSLGIGEITFERALAARAVEEPVEWTILQGEEDVGSLLFTVRPAADSSCELHSRARIRVPISGFSDGRFDLVSVIHVDPLKRLDRLDVSMSLPGGKTEIVIAGNAEPDGRLALKARLLVDGKEAMHRDIETQIDPKMMVLDLFGQIDKLPDLRPGKSWRTRFINPLRALVGGTLAPSNSMDFVEHTVVATEPIDWHGEWTNCYKVEHRYEQTRTHSWARVSDGKVLVQEVQFAGMPFRLVVRPTMPDPPAPIVD